MATPLPSLDSVNKALVQQSILIAGTTAPDLNEIPFKLSTTEQMEPNGPPQLQM
jgi:hypothetical protein